MKLGKIFGFEISLDPSWFIVFALVVSMLLGGAYPHLFAVKAGTPSLALAVVGALALFGSVLAHELGHTVVGRALGVKIEGITLFIFGGIARLKDEPRTPSVEFRMTLAGPAVSAALAVAFYAVGRFGMAHHWSPEGVSVLGYLSLANRAITLFNMVPAFPLDGGRILRSVLWMAQKDVVRATKWAGNVSRLIAFGVIVVGVAHVATGDLMGLWYVFMGLFVMSVAASAYRQVALRSKLEGVTVASLMQHALPVPANMPLNWVADEWGAASDQAAFPVMEGETLKGILSMEDIHAIPIQRWPWTLAVEVCEPVVDEGAIEDREDAWQALTKMLAANARRLLVLHNGHVEGVLTRDQVLSLLQMGRGAR